MTSPYNLDLYSALLANAQRAGYRFIGFDAISDGATGSGRFLLRHDVDADVGAALRMGREEARLGVRATYFVMLRSPCYNLMSRWCQRAIEELVGLGHHVGLHFDQGFDEGRTRTATGVSATIREESEWLERLFRCYVHAVSFHQPSVVALPEGIDCGRRVNTYDRQRLSAFRYISDSNRTLSLLDPAADEATNGAAFARLFPNDIQLLVHPMWWVHPGGDTASVWDRVIRSNLGKMQEQLVATERAYGPSRQFEVRAMDGTTGRGAGA